MYCEYHHQDCIHRIPYHITAIVDATSSSFENNPLFIFPSRETVNTWMSTLKSYALILKMMTSDNFDANDDNPDDALDADALPASVAPAPSNRCFWDMVSETKIRVFSLTLGLVGRSLELFPVGVKGGAHVIGGADTVRCTDPCPYWLSRVRMHSHQIIDAPRDPVDAAVLSVALAAAFSPPANWSAVLGGANVPPLPCMAVVGAQIRWMAFCEGRLLS